jgi:hypothetical protein
VVVLEIGRFIGERAGGIRVRAFCRTGISKANAVRLGWSTRPANW